jgi:hypothetical protein
MPIRRERHSSTPASLCRSPRGRFTVYLGDKKQLQLDKLHHANAVWLEIHILQQCGSDISCSAGTSLDRTLSPRLQLASTAFAASAAYCATADNAQSIGGISASALQPKLADVMCAANQALVGVQGGLPMCGTAPSSSSASPSQSKLPDVTCPSGQLLAGIQGGVAVCVPAPKDGGNSASQSAASCTWYTAACQTAGATGESCQVTCPSGNYVSAGACDLANGIALNESRPFGSTNNQPQGVGPFVPTLFDSWACKPTTNMARDVNSAYALCCPR